MKTLIAIIINICLVGSSYATDKPFQDYFYSSSVLSTKCANASDIKYAVEPGTTCTIAIRIPLFQKPGANLARLSKQFGYHPISFWLEKRIENGKNEWQQITGKKLYRFNDVYQGLNFQVTKTAIYRIAIDYKDRGNFADDYGNQVRVSVK